MSAFPVVPDYRKKTGKTTGATTKSPEIGMFLNFVVPADRRKIAC
ncbi:hypothetical protein [Oxalobacter formigenes]|nr:hypothetical protein [Oxalobacter formigenes]